MSNKNNYFPNIINKYSKNFLRIFSVKKNDGNALISVIIPVYNRTKLLIESIESILKQTYSPYEIIMVCDGSPNQTVEIVKEYQEKYNNIRGIFYSTNSGNAVRGRNRGIIEAKGIYCAFHDSDDVADPNRLLNSLHTFRKYHVDVVYGGWRAIVENNNLRREIENNQIVLSSEFDIEKLKQDNFICQSTVMAKKAALVDVGGFNKKMKYREDHELWLRLAYHGYKFKSIDKILTNLRLHNENLELKFKKDDEYWYDTMLKLYKIKINLQL